MIRIYLFQLLSFIFLYVVNVLEIEKKINRSDTTKTTNFVCGKCAWEFKRK
jgi:hypothetical protein